MAVMELDYKRLPTRPPSTAPNLSPSSPSRPPPQPKKSDTKRQKATLSTPSPECRISPAEHNPGPDPDPRPPGAGERSSPGQWPVTVNLPGVLSTPPMVTTTGCVPAGTLPGTVKLIWVTPTSPYGIPTKKGVTGTPPTVKE